MGILIAFAIWHFCLDKAERDLLLAITRLKKYNTSPGSVPAQLQKMLPESEHETIPNFFVVGAPRCGTTLIVDLSLEPPPDLYELSEGAAVLRLRSDENSRRISGAGKGTPISNCFVPARTRRSAAKPRSCTCSRKMPAREIYQCNPKARILICLRKSRRSGIFLLWPVALGRL